MCSLTSLLLASVSLLPQVKRVQNETLYRQYAAKKSDMKKQNPSIENEKMLWHGTSSGATEKINYHGFNRSYCGKNGMFSVGQELRRICNTLFFLSCFFFLISVCCELTDTTQITIIGLQSMLL